MPKSDLRHGYTTGACAAAAAKGAAMMLRRQQPVDEVDIVLPLGQRATFRLHGQEFDETSASCFVVKDAGDDPDVTNGAEVHVMVRRELRKRPVKTMIFVKGGRGIGKVTKPGLAVPVGEPAINPVPMRMIIEAMKEEFSVVCLPEALYVTVSIPNGEELAKKTLNARLGIVGGLSILGTTGIVKPISAAAWTDTIDSAIDVALACGCETVVFSTGRTSEVVAQDHLSHLISPPLMDPLGPKGGGEGEGGGVVDLQAPPLSLALSHQGRGNKIKEEAFVMMGDYFGHALRSAAQKGVRRVVIAAQFAKLLKIACGHEQTHVNSSELDLRTLARWAKDNPEGDRLLPVIEGGNTARHVLEASGNDPLLLDLVCAKAKEFAKTVAPQLEVKVLLAGYHATVLYFG